MVRIQTEDVQFKKAVEAFVDAKLIDESILEFEIVPVFSPEQSTILVKKEDHKLFIHYPKKVLFFRGLCVLAPELVQSGKGSLEEEVTMESVSFSLEASRNGVMKLDVLKYYIQSLVAMGYTTLYLYTEDTYEVDGYPYFGYLRGRYSKEELKEIVAFADDYGMEVIPAIQTLAHITQLLRWPAMGGVRDDANTLLIDEPETYRLIEAMLQTVKECFPAGKVHLGMDEAYQAGLGQYLEKHGFVDRFTLIARHLHKVLELVEKYELEPIIWSDFIYRLLDKEQHGGYYPIQAVIDEEKAKQLPKYVTYVHWDYGGEDLPRYEEAMKRHFQFSDRDHYVYAGAAHIYGSMSPNHGKALRSTSVGLQAARNMEVKHVMLTTWGDDGQEVSHWHALPVAYGFANQVYTGIPSVEADLATGFDRLFGKGSFALLYKLRKLDEIEGVEEGNYFMANPSKFLLWQDPLLGIFDAHVVAYNQTGDLEGYYQNLAQELDAASLAAKQEIFSDIQKQYALLAEILAEKGVLGVNLRAAYGANEREILEGYVENIIPGLIEKFESLRLLHQQIWLATYKPNGWETLDIRYGGVIARLKSTMARLKAYLKGEVTELPELAEERLPFTKGTTPMSINCSKYGDIANIGYFF